MKLCRCQGPTAAWWHSSQSSFGLQYIGRCAAVTTHGVFVRSVSASSRSSHAYCFAICGMLWAYG